MHCIRISQYFAVAASRIVQRCPTAMLRRVPHGGPGGGNGPGGAPGGLGIPAAATAWDLKSQVPTLEETGRNERVEIVETCRKDQRCSPEFF